MLRSMSFLLIGCTDKPSSNPRFDIEPMFASNVLYANGGTGTS